jgi:hypothetical protein
MHAPYASGAGLSNYCAYAALPPFYGLLKRPLEEHAIAAARDGIP